MKKLLSSSVFCLLLTGVPSIHAQQSAGTDATPNNSAATAPKANANAPAATAASAAASASDKDARAATSNKRTAGASKSGSHAVAAAPIPSLRYFSSPLSQQIFALLYAEMLLQRGASAQAVQVITYLTEKYKDPDISRRAIEMLQSTGNNDKILGIARMWVSIAPNDIEARQRLAGAMIRLQRVDDLATHIDFLLKASPSKLPANILGLNNLFSSFKDKQAVVKLLDQITANYLNMPEAWLVRATAAANAGNPEAADSLALKASQMRPDWDLPVLFRANNARKPQEAVTLLQSFQASYPQSRPVRQQLVRMLSQDGRLDEVEAIIRSGLSSAPDDPELLYTLGLLSLDKKQYNDAESIFKKLLETDQIDKDRLRYLLAQVAELKKEIPTALGYYQQIVDGDQYLPARIRMAVIAADQKDFNAARKIIADTRASNTKEKIRLTLIEAQLLRNAHQLESAYQLINQALLTYPNQVELLYESAVYAEKLQLYADMEARLRQALKIEPNNPHFLNALGYSFADRNIQLREAENLIVRALKVLPEDPHILDSLGWIYFRKGKYRDAKEVLEKAYKLMPEPEIAAHITEVLWAEGKKADAAKFFEEADKKSPQHEALQRVRQLVSPSLTNPASETVTESAIVPTPTVSSSATLQATPSSSFVQPK